MLRRLVWMMGGALLVLPALGTAEPVVAVGPGEGPPAAPFRDAALLGTADSGSGAGAASQAPPESTAPDLRHRGPGIRTSMFGTYVRPRELLVYTFFEYYRDHDLQYAPAEFGYGLDEDFAGRYRASEGLVFLAYGLSDRFAIEVEAAVIHASLIKDPNDPTGMPAKIEEEGIGDVEGQLTWRWARENARRPEFFSYLELVIPHHEQEPLRGTSDWEAKLGTGATRGLPWGNVQARIALEYARASESPWDLGEWAVEYLRRLSPSWGVYAGLEGQALDELALITEVQRSLGSHATLKIGNGLGLTANTTDLAPEVGVIFSLPTSR